MEVHEEEELYTECVFCGELRAEHEFHDGLRCKICASEDEREEQD